MPCSGVPSPSRRQRETQLRRPMGLILDRAPTMASRKVPQKPCAGSKHQIRRDSTADGCEGDSAPGRRSSARSQPSVLMARGRFNAVVVTQNAALGKTAAGSVARADATEGNAPLIGKFASHTNPGSSNVNPYQCFNSNRAGRGTRRRGSSDCDPNDNNTTHGNCRLRQYHHDGLLNSLPDTHLRRPRITDPD